MRQLLHPDWVIPVQPRGAVLDRYMVLIEGDRIAAVLSEDQARLHHPDVPVERLAGRALLPGLVNAHSHAAMSLLRGMADDVPLMTWLTEHIWPAEGRWVSERFVEDGTRLACYEFLLSGITCFNDMYFFPEAAARAVLESGLRATLGLTVLEFPTPYARDADDYLSKGLAARDALRGEPRLRFALAPHAPYTVSDDTFRRLMTFAEELDLPVHLHVHETRSEVEEGVRQHGVRPIARLQGLGVIGPRLIAVHCVHLNDSEITLFAREGVHVAHCPHSNLKLASGIAPIAALRAAGVQVALGTDGAASNNRLDLLGELHTASLLAKGSSGDAAALPAAEALEMVTLAGAQALGQGEQLGSITPGKLADLITVRLDEPSTLPVFDPIAHIVYSADRSQVEDVWVGGERLLRGRLPTRIDPALVRRQALAWGQQLASRH